MSPPDRDGDVWARLVAYIAERVTLPTADIERVLTCEQEFWAERPALADAVQEADDDDSGPRA